MGCSCFEMTFEDEVEEQVLLYISSLKRSEVTKLRLIKHIKADLSKRALTLDKYHYPYRKDDIEKTVSQYKELVNKKLNGNGHFLEEKKNSNSNEIRTSNKEEFRENNTLILNRNIKNDSANFDNRNLTSLVDKIELHKEIEDPKKEEDKKIEDKIEEDKKEEDKKEEDKKQETIKEDDKEDEKKSLVSIIPIKKMEESIILNKSLIEEESKNDEKSIVFGVLQNQM